jgi:hypothetical protein
MTIEEIKIANSTYRRSGSSVFDKDGNVRSVVTRYVEKNIGVDKKILDYGCGAEFIQGNYLRLHGFDVDGWDIGNNKPEDCVDELRQIYDVIYASNVLNVISSESMLTETLGQVYDCLKSGGVFIANYPSAPRKMVIDVRLLSDVIQNKFGSTIHMVGGVKSAPIWCVAKL